MFSGIVYCKARVRAARPAGSGRYMELMTEKPLLKPVRGMSIAVNGVCLTAVRFSGLRVFGADVSSETYDVTALKHLKTGSVANIEFPVTPDSFLSGHIVQGHVDACGAVVSLNKRKNDTVLTVSYPQGFSKYLVEKGSVCVDGVSLTAFNIRKGMFDVSVIPETLSSTVIGGYKTGVKVNIEFDIIGKYTEKFMRGKK